MTFVVQTAIFILGKLSIVKQVIASDVIFIQLQMSYAPPFCLVSTPQKRQVVEGLAGLFCFIPCHNAFNHHQQILQNSISYCFDEHACFTDCGFVFLTFHSKPVTAMPPAAPVPARPMNRPEPSELAKRDDPICARQKKRFGGFTGILQKYSAAST